MARATGGARQATFRSLKGHPGDMADHVNICVQVGVRNACSTGIQVYLPKAKGHGFVVPVSFELRPRGSRIQSGS